MSIVRNATPADIPWLLEQLRAFAEYYGHVGGHLLYPGDVQARGMLTRWIEEHVVLIAQNDVRIGVIAGAVVSHPYNERLRLLQELFLWVAPDQRGTGAWKRLVDALHDYGRQQGAHAVQFSAVDDRMGDALTRQGYRLCERAYIRDLARVS